MKEQKNAMRRGSEGIDECDLTSGKTVGKPTQAEGMRGNERLTDNPPR